MKDKSITQKDLAALVNISEKQVGRILRGESDPSLETFRQICHHLGADFTEVLTGETREQYAARRYTRGMAVSENKGKYGGQAIGELVSKIYKLDPDDRQLVEQLIDKLSEKRT